MKPKHLCERGTVSKVCDVTDSDSEERGGSSEKKKVEWIIFFVARLELYTFKIRVRTQCMCVCLL